VERQATSDTSKLWYGTSVPMVNISVVLVALLRARCRFLKGERNKSIFAQILNEASLEYEVKSALCVQG
jgi:hypothetical protein